MKWIRIKIAMSLWTWGPLTYAMISVSVSLSYNFISKRSRFPFSSVRHNYFSIESPLAIITIVNKENMKKCTQNAKSSQIKEMDKRKNQQRTHKSQIRPYIPKGLTWNKLSVNGANCCPFRGIYVVEFCDPKISTTTTKPEIFQIFYLGCTHRNSCTHLKWVDRIRGAEGERRNSNWNQLPNISYKRHSHFILFFSSWIDNVGFYFI